MQHSKIYYDLHYNAIMCTRCCSAEVVCYEILRVCVCLRARCRDEGASPATRVSALGTF